MSIEDNNNIELSNTPLNGTALPAVERFFRDVTAQSREVQRASMDALFHRLAGRAGLPARSIALQRNRTKHGAQELVMPVPDSISLQQIEALHASMNGDPCDAAAKSLLHGFLVRMNKLIDMNRRMSY